MTQNTHGFIARNTAVKGLVSYRGYDLKEKNIHKAARTIDDYEIIFNTFSCERMAKLDASKVLGNINKTTTRVFDDSLHVSEQVEQLDKEVAEEQERVIPVNGKVIESIICKGDKQQAVLRSKDLEAANLILQEMFTGLCEVQAQTMLIKREIKFKYRKGTLDIAVENGAEYLVQYQTEDAKSLIPVGGQITTAVVKQTLYYMCDLYLNDPEYLNKINCEHKTSAFRFVVKNSKLSIEKLQGNFTEMELDIAKDLIKMF